MLVSQSRSGRVEFFFDRYNELLITTTLDGYTPDEMLVTIGDQQYDFDNPLIIRLFDSPNTVYHNAWLTCSGGRYFTNRSRDINCSVYARGRSLVTYNTEYRFNTGLTTQQPTTCSVLGRCDFTLTAGTHFATTGNNNITIIIELDNTFWDNRTLIYDDTTETGIFERSIFEGINSNILNPILHGS